MALVRRQADQGGDETLSTALSGAAEDLPAPEDADAFGQIFDRFANAKIVLLGEATHGTHEFYQARAAISRHLIHNCGFNIVAVEADWPDAAQVDRYVRHKDGNARAGVFARFPGWMWRNAEVSGFVEWLRDENEHRPLDSRAEFRGLDIYSLNASMAAVLEYLDRVDPQSARIARDRYGCLTPWQDDPAHYGHRAAMGADTCEEAVLAQLMDMLNRRLDYAARDGEPYFEAAQNARIVRAAERYYRIMYKGSRESWNLRDRHMFDTLQSLMEHRKNAKAIVWAHNSHIGNAAATVMGWEGEFNIGELCRNAYGSEVVAIGFGTDRGTVMAASQWDGAAEIMDVRPARADSFEYLFRHAGHARTLTDWRKAHPALRDKLAVQKRERAIGVIYRPETELFSHYFDAVMADQFDAYVWFEMTRAVTPLSAQPQRVSHAPSGDMFFQ